MPDKKRLIFAHRGLYSSGVPENSLAAFENAVLSGLGIELDVRLTKDGIPVVFHDRTLKRMCGDPRKVSQLTLNEIQSLRLGGTDQKIPSLTEALELIDGRTPLLIETKLPKRYIWFHTLERKIIPIIKSYAGEVLIQSFNSHSVRFLKRSLPEIQCGILSGSLYSEPKGFDFISYKLSGLTAERSAELRKKYPMLFAWSLTALNNKQINSAFNDLSLDGIII